MQGKEGYQKMHTNHDCKIAGYYFKIAALMYKFEHGTRRISH